MCDLLILSAIRKLGVAPSTYSTLRWSVNTAALEHACRNTLERFCCAVASHVTSTNSCLEHAPADSIVLLCSENTDMGGSLTKIMNADSHLNAAAQLSTAHQKTFPVVSWASEDCSNDSQAKVSRVLSVSQRGDMLCR